MQNLLLQTFVSAKTLGYSIRENARHRLADESGAETIQVIMIMGIMAVVVIAVMSVVQGGLDTLAKTVTGCIKEITGTPTDTCKWGQ